MILSIIPTSVAISYAVLAGLGPHEIISVGRLVSSTQASQTADCPTWLREYLQQPSLRAAVRISGLMRDVLDLVDEHQPNYIVVRIPCAMFGSRVSENGRGSLAVYGLAAGAIWAAMEQAMPGRVIPVTDRMWFEARGPKLKHQHRIAAIYSRYQACNDSKAEIANAIGLARWSLTDVQAGASKK